LEGQAEAAERTVDLPEDQTLPFTYAGRGRGAGAALAAIGLALFFAPWVTLERPDEITLTGHDLATANAPWIWGGAVGYFILILLLLSRRTVNQLYGIRAIAGFFPLMTLGEVAMLLFNPPEAHRYFGPGLEYTWGLYASALSAIVCIVVSVRLGGSLKDFRDLPLEVPASGPATDENLH
jgi:hypothetical protein